MPHATVMRLLSNPLSTPFLVLGELMLGLMAATGVLAQESRFEVVREGEFVTVTATADLAADPRLAWAVLTDYESYPRFVTDMRTSKILSRGGQGSEGPVVVEQKGEFGFLLFTQPIDVRMVVFENPPRSIVARSIGGSFRDFVGRYEIMPLAGGMRLSYTGRFSPDFILPPLVGMTAVRYLMQKRFNELVGEILRREAQARPPARDARGAAAVLPQQFPPSMP